MNNASLKRELSSKYHIFPSGPRNQISDVSSISVGHYRISSSQFNTGMTVIHPSENPYDKKHLAGFFCANGFGKFIGSTQIEELGIIETPIVLTNTLAVHSVANFVKDYVKEQNTEAFSINPVVGEINDSALSDIRKSTFTYDNFLSACTNASRKIEEGCVGAGTGGYCMGYKGGIGTASKILPAHSTGLSQDYTVGVLMVTNFEGLLNIKGYPIGFLEDTYKRNDLFSRDEGSCIIIVATDAPLDSRQLNRLAKRATYALGRVGSMYTHGSGDYAVTFSTYGDNLISESDTAERNFSFVFEEKLSYFFWATIEAVEAATYSALLHATDMQYQGYTLKAIGSSKIQECLEKLP
ncbi:P1 family peptidase [Candidatus Roizmanbacteria bacterium]|nr:P1 family peptidase [Candidatus Roizmanbacteria bacterium]